MLLATLFVTALGLVPTQTAPAAAEPRLEMMTYQMVLLHAGTEGLDQPARERLMEGHLARLGELNQRRVNVLYGPFTDQGPLRGIVVMDVRDASEAKQMMAEDPFVKAGIMTVEVRPWMAPKGWFHEPPDRNVTNHQNLEALVFGFLVGGPNRSQTEAEAAEIQKGHLAYMSELAKQGKLVAAGPFMDEGDARGVVIYRVPTVEDAKQLAAGDPAVKAGRLKIEAHPWMTLRGILK